MAVCRKNISLTELIDLGAWAEGKYAIPAEDAPGTDEEEG